MTTVYDCYKTPDEYMCFDFREAWHDYRGDDGYSILGNRDFVDYLTPEVAEIVGDWRNNYELNLNDVADELTKRHGEQYRVGTLTGCCQSDWQYIIYPARFKDELSIIEQEYFNQLDGWHCKSRDGEDDFYGFTYPLVGESVEEQLKDMCRCDEVVIHRPHRTYTWD